MADYYSTACGGANAAAVSNKFSTGVVPAFFAGAPAKSGVRDVLRIPFAVWGDSTTVLTNGDYLYLAKVAAAHRVVGYYIEAVSVDTGVNLRTSLQANDTGGAYTDLVTSSSIGNLTNAAGAVLSQFGARTAAGAVATTPGTFVVGALPTGAFSADGLVRLAVTATATGNASWKFSGYIETLPV
ncbi:hypothetical protein UFOVP1287_47 [uncultured Caudovirales phage]|uniref:Uncharacterized protein n=1 Tax=uncultured Caudovirales phage TaxID=2100421 RepID=A0A6J5RR38_9CAUD|nr:hypothetical protein UFOVP1287_47 [uncultured Caudovirales phage]CAB4205325.1 hypothetical protein UFOVP1408_66 [uncultured Caudovirales phage]